MERNQWIAILTAMTIILGGGAVLILDSDSFEIEINNQTRASYEDGELSIYDGREKVFTDQIRIYYYDTDKEYSGYTRMNHAYGEKHYSNLSYKKQGKVHKVNQTEYYSKGNLTRIFSITEEGIVKQDFKWKPEKESIRTYFKWRYEDMEEGKANDFSDQTSARVDNDYKISWEKEKENIQHAKRYDNGVFELRTETYDGKAVFDPYVFIDPENAQAEVYEDGVKFDYNQSNAKLDLKVWKKTNGQFQSPTASLNVNYDNETYKVGATDLNAKKPQRYAFTFNASLKGRQLNEQFFEEHNLRYRLTNQNLEIDNTLLCEQGYKNANCSRDTINGLNAITFTANQTFDPEITLKSANRSLNLRTKGVRKEANYSHLLPSNSKEQHTSYDGRNDYINTSQRPEKNLSISVWAKLENDSSGFDKGIFSTTNGSGSEGFKLFYQNSFDQYKFQSFGSGGTLGADIGGSSANFGQWQHYVITMNDSQAQMYIDGSSVGTDSNTKLSQLRDMEIGSYNVNETFPQRAWSGDIDEFNIYNRTLSSSEVSTIYNENRSDTSVSSNLTFEQTFDEYSPLSDQFGNDITLKGDTSLVPEPEFGDIEISQYHPFDRKDSGNFYDYSKNDCDFNDEPRVDGVIGKSVYTSNGGISNVCTGANIPAFNDDLFSYSMWINFTALSDADIIRVEGIGRGHGFGLKNGNLSVYNKGNFNIYESDLQPSTNGWHHIAFVHNSSNQSVEFFMNNQKDTLQNSNLSLEVPSSGSYELGTNANFGGHLQGSIDEYMVTNFLEDKQVDRLRNFTYRRFAYEKGNVTPQNFEIENETKLIKGLDWKEYSNSDAQTYNSTDMNLSLWESNPHNDTGYITNWSSLKTFYSLDRDYGSGEFKDLAGDDNLTAVQNYTQSENHKDYRYDKGLRVYGLTGSDARFESDRHKDVFNQTNWTISFWIKGYKNASSCHSTNYCTVAGYGGANSGQMKFRWVQNSNSWYIDMHGSTTLSGKTIMAQTSSANYNTSHHVVFQRTNETTKAYWDGQLVDEDKNSKGIVSQTSNFFVGDDNNANSGNFSLDQMLMFNRTLSNHSIKELYLTGAMDRAEEQDKWGYKQNGVGIDYSFNEEKQVQQKNSTHLDVTDFTPKLTSDWFLFDHELISNDNDYYSSTWTETTFNTTIADPNVSVQRLIEPIIFDPPFPNIQDLYPINQTDTNGTFRGNGSSFDVQNFGGSGDVQVKTNQSQDTRWRIETKFGQNGNWTEINATNYTTVGDISIGENKTAWLRADLNYPAVNWSGNFTWRGVP